VIVVIWKRVSGPREPTCEVKDVWEASPPDSQTPPLGSQKTVEGLRIVGVVRNSFSRQFLWVKG